MRRRSARGGFQLVPDALLVKQESCYFGSQTKPVISGCLPGNRS
jgi:hypothetical protein